MHDNNMHIFRNIGVPERFLYTQNCKTSHNKPKDFRPIRLSSFLLEILGLSHIEGGLELKAFSLEAFLDIGDDFNSGKPKAIINGLERLHIQQPIIRLIKRLICEQLPYAKRQKGALYRAELGR